MNCKATGVARGKSIAWHVHSPQVLYPRKVAKDPNNHLFASLQCEAFGVFFLIINLPFITHLTYVLRV